MHYRHSERGKKTRQTEEEVGRQHQGMGRLGVRQVPEGSGEQGKMEKTGCKIICGAPTTLAVKGLMMMMMIMNALSGDVERQTLTSPSGVVVLCPIGIWHARLSSDTVKTLSEAKSVCQLQKQHLWQVLTFIDI